MIDTTEGRLAMLASGETTIAELEGMTAAEAYALAELGWMLLGQGRTDAARLVFETLALANPHHAYFHALLGAALQRAGRDDEALEAYARAIAIDPNETGALVNRAEVLLARGDERLGEAVELLERAIAFDADAARPETRRARALAAAAAERAGARGAPGAPD